MAIHRLEESDIEVNKKRASASRWLTDLANLEQKLAAAEAANFAANEALRKAQVAADEAGQDFQELIDLHKNHLERRASMY